MITRAYQNAKGERQEITLSADQWEMLTEADLDNMLGFGKAAKAAPAPDSEPVAEAAPAVKKAPFKKGK